VLAVASSSSGALGGPPVVSARETERIGPHPKSPQSRKQLTAANSLE
jgi:hypothetical protein